MSATTGPGLRKTVSAAGQNFAIPRSAIQEIVRENSASVSLEQVGSAHIARIRDQRIPVVALEAVLGLPETQGEGARSLVVLNPTGKSPWLNLNGCADAEICSALMHPTAVGHLIL